MATLVAKHEPIYGINTGFGRLASVRIDDADLAALQRNIVLSHAAGVGEALQAPIVRLVLSLKVASLAQGASGVRWRTLAEQKLAELDVLISRAQGMKRVLEEGIRCQCLNLDECIPLVSGRCL